MPIIDPFPLVRVIVRMRPLPLSEANVLNVCADSHSMDNMSALYSYSLHLYSCIGTVKMEHDLLPRQTQLLNSDSYVANTTFRNVFTWYSQKTGNILIEKQSKKNAILAVVGKVLENRMDCEGHGNFKIEHTKLSGKQNINSF